MYVLRQTWSIYTSNNRLKFQQGPLILGAKSACSFHSTYHLEHDDHFYNRAWEIKQLSARLRSQPTFTVLLGPPSSGKTALVRQVASLRRADQSPEFHPLTIDLRAADTSKNGTFLNAFLRQARDDAEGGWWNKWLSRLELSIGEVSAKFGPKHVFPLPASDVFNNLSEMLKPWNVVHGKSPPLIVVDEANSFKRMDDDTIQAFFDFAVWITKQERKMHIILTSSDSFFGQWLKNRINPTHFSTCVVGDLPQQEAHKYFLNVVENHPQLSEEMKDSLKLLDFNIPFKMTGGRMFFIEKYVSQVCASGYFDDPMDFEPITNAYALMEDDFLGVAKTYKKQEAIDVAQHLINSPGYISYANLVMKFSKQMVEEMIERNFLHYRPSAQFSRDLVPPPSGPVVTAQSVPSLRAMEALLKKFSRSNSC